MEVVDFLKFLPRFFAAIFRILAPHGATVSFLLTLKQRHNYKIVDDWKYAHDQNLITGVVFMDLSKAFDCLHSLLIAKLHAYGADWSACELLVDCLSHRFQRVKIITARRSWAELSKGVPQGSVLGPLLFNILVNDLISFIKKCALYNYADDNSMSHSSPTLQGVLSSLLNDCKIAIEWFGNTGMKVNPAKFEFMVLSPNPIDDIELKLDEKTILIPEKSAKALGVIIDDRLTFSDHIHYNDVIITMVASQITSLTVVYSIVYLGEDQRK